MPKTSLTETCSVLIGMPSRDEEKRVVSRVTTIHIKKDTPVVIRCVQSLIDRLNFIALAVVISILCGLRSVVILVLAIAVAVAWTLFDGLLIIFRQSFQSFIAILIHIIMTGSAIFALFLLSLPILWKLLVSMMRLIVVFIELSFFQPLLADTDY